MQNPILAEDFLLDTGPARRLYNDFAGGQPIVDFHNHLSAEDIAQDRVFDNISQLWLETDHYKWRAMRANGVPEGYVTGSQPDYDRFERWAETVPFTIANPLFHWTHLELHRAFGISDLLGPDSARAIYDRTAEALGTSDFSTRRLIARSGACVLCTTDDPVDSLASHRLLQETSQFEVSVYPTFRPDRALAVVHPASFNEWVDALEARTGREIRTLVDFLDVLQLRHDAFHEAGCRLADHGLETFPGEDYVDSRVARTFTDLRAGTRPGASEIAEYQSAVLQYLAGMNHASGWTQQFHVGPIRDVNTRLRSQLGNDAGADSIGDMNHAASMARFLDRLDRDDCLAPTILYNVNPRDNAVFAAMAGSFNDGTVPGKIQYGPAWWFLDQMEGIADHIRTVSNYGLLPRFVGMVTDSRSLLSLYSRHEYFRRVLCRVLGRDIEGGLLPNDFEWIGGIVRAICSENAVVFLGLEDDREV